MGKQFVNCLILYALVNIGQIITASAEIAANEEQITDWEYEPRIWSVSEEQDQNQDLYNHEDIIINDNYEGDDVQDNSAEINLENPRLRHHYLEPELDITTRQQEGSWSRCSQFRVDTRDAVVCDKNHCDKLTLEWPKYDNQLTVVLTTKQGMRFNKIDYAFASNPKRASRSHRSAGERVKFDLLELFKPSTTTTTTTTTSTTTAAPSETTTTESATEAETEATTETESETTTTANNQPAPTDGVSSITRSTSNATQLVTTFRVSTSRRRQNIVGFGGALTDSTCRNIKSLSPRMGKSLMEDYFGDRGIKYNMVRMTIGGSDFSTRQYTNNDRDINITRSNRLNKDEKEDFDMDNFRLVEEDYDYKLPVARQAIATSRQELKFIASLWSPPIWMKNNSDFVHGFLKGDIYGPYYKALAELMIKWLEAYRNNGIDFWGFTGLNEPVTGAKPFIHHNSLEISREDYITFIKLYLGPMLRRRGFSDVQLMALDDNKGIAPFLVKSILEDKEAAKYVSGIAVHWYMNDEYENLNFISKRHPDKFILSTEACNGFLPFQVHALPGNWDRGVAYMLDIIKLLQKNSVGWVDWNMALDTIGGPTWAKNFLDAPIIVNSQRDEYYKSPMFYAIGHFSAFIGPNSTRLDHRLANAKFDYPVEAVAFLTPKQDHVAIVALNANKHLVPFKIVVDRRLVRVVNLRAESFSTILFRWKSKK